MLRPLLVALIACLCLTGCIQYDVGINYASQTQGEIVQRLRLGEQLTSLNNPTARAWVSTVEQRARDVGGHVRRPSKQEVIVTIPFNNGKDLQSRFNKFFQITDGRSPQSGQASGLEIPQVESHLTVKESNLILLQRNRLSYDLDLRSLGVLSADGSLIVSPGSLLEFEFSLTTPWGARSSGSSLPPRRQNHQLTWTLAAGERHHLESVFWVPSPLGIGTAAIALLVAIGSYLKHQVDDLNEQSKTEQPSEQLSR